MIRGIGVDVIEVDRIRRATARWGDGFLSRVFTPGEQRHAGFNDNVAGASLARARGPAARHHVTDAASTGSAGTSRTLAERLAGRFAAKEAVMKALGLGWRRMAWREIEIGGDPLGRPVVRLTGRAAEAAAELGVQAWFVSISHTRTLAVAHAVAE